MEYRNADSDGNQEGTDQSWIGESCVAWLWPHTFGDSRFEARRAIANLTHGLRRATRASASGEPDAVDVLVFVEAANGLKHAVDDVLAELVAEARSRGATWEEIGARLGGLSRKATHKRYKQGLSKDAERRLAVDKKAHRLASTLFLDNLPDGAPRGLSEEDWDAAPPAVAIPYALRNLVKAHEYLENATNEQGRFGVEGFSSGFEVLRQSVNILLSSNALSTIESTWEGIEDRHSLYDENACTYFIHCGCQASAALLSFSEFIANEDSFGDEGLHYYAQGLVQLGDAITAMVRPELVLVANALDLEAQAEGHAVYTRNDDTISAEVGQQIADAYWRGDENAMRQLEAQVGTPRRHRTTRP